jgi:arylsulfatase A-like enzyme
VALRPALCGPLAAALLGERLCDSAAAVTRHALARLDQLRPANAKHGAPFLLWIHYIDPHAPYGCGGNKTFRGDTLLSPIRGAAPGLGERFEAIARLRGGEIRLTAAEKEQLIALYDASVADVDRHAGRVLERLLDAAGNVGDDLLVIVVSDHSEEFWDHGGVEHGHTFYDELVRVPLIFGGGGLDPGRLGGVVRLTDVAPTVLDLAGISPPSGLDGATLVSGRDGRIRLAAGGRVAICESLLFAEEKVALRTERWKYVRWENGKEELYDLASDPRELRDLAGSASLDWARRLLGETAATNGQPPPGSHVDSAAIRAAMERLGYA